MPAPASAISGMAPCLIAVEAGDVELDQLQTRMSNRLREALVKSLRRSPPRAPHRPSRQRIGGAAAVTPIATGRCG